jgi:hypothetical protein
MSSPQTNQEIARIMSAVYARAMIDPDFCADFVANPNQVLADHGLVIPAGIQFHVVKDYQGGDQGLPTSAGSDVYLVYPVPDEAVSFDTLSTEEQSPEDAIHEVVLGGTLICSSGTGGTFYSAEDLASPPASSAAKAGPPSTQAPGAPGGAAQSAGPGDEPPPPLHPADRPERRPWPEHRADPPRRPLGEAADTDQ